MDLLLRLFLKLPIILHISFADHIVSGSAGEEISGPKTGFEPISGMG